MKTALYSVSKEIKTIAVIGPLRDSKENMLGGWGAAGRVGQLRNTSGRDSRQKPGDTIKVLFEKGCEITGTEQDGFSNALAAARKADFVILALGESQNMSGEAFQQADISLPGTCTTGAGTHDHFP